MKKVFSVVFTAVFAICVLGFFSPAQASAASLGSLNIREVLASYPDVQTTNAAIDLERQKAQTEFNKKAASLDEKGKKELFEKINAQVETRQEELLKPIREKIKKAVEAVAKEKGLDTIVDASVIIYGGQDITKDVIEKLKTM
ncbi:OmpH family outer membrane protein [Pectinatus sottacetonis]|uniref:OmpH family outer membrane protein n=1 Tax=Pectinatus sottacetonis TaxID=1002795 RepID=UPI0018C76722|nr:OmpH family outer membrane protein [Pectinatus sottacetonis]